MREFEERIRQAAAVQGHLISRPEVNGLGGSDSTLRRRVEDGRWARRQAGVYQIDQRPMGWTDSLWAGVLAGGPGSLVSHRAALVLWDMDGLRSAPVEITVPYSNRPIPEGTIVHRTRRRLEAFDVRGVPITSPERTLLDVSPLLPPVVLSKAVESSIRLEIATVDSILEVISIEGGRGVRGTRKLKRVMADRHADTATESGSETELLFHMRRGGIREPELQHELITKDGDVIRPDFYWPKLAKAVEVDGLDAHSTAEALDHDLARQNALLTLGIELRRFSGRAVRRRPDQVVEEIRQFLET